MLHNLAGMASSLASTGLMVHGPMYGKQIIFAFWNFFPIVVGLSTWCSELRNKRVLFTTDTENVVHVINKQTAKDPKMLGLLRAMVLICLRNNIFFRARHIPGVKNVLADSLSRLQVDKFHTLSRGMDPTPTPLPAHLLPENWVID